MFSKTHRLKKQKEIDCVLARGSAFHSKLTRFKCFSSGRKETRFCFIVSSAVAKSAVDRNKIKRRLREAVRVLMPYVAGGRDIVIWAQKNALNANYSDFVGDLRISFSKAGVLTVGA